MSDIAEGASRQERLKKAIADAKEKNWAVVIAECQETGKFKLLAIGNTNIGDEMDPCYQVAQKNNCIAIAVCNSKKYGGEINYCDL